MHLLEQDLFLKQPYAYCSHLGRIQAVHNGIFTTDSYGFRRSYYGNQPITYKEFIDISEEKLWIAGNSVPYGVSVAEDSHVFSNILSRNYCMPAYNISIRASTIYQDFICLARLVEGLDDQTIVWVAGLNDVIAMMAGTFSHPFFPPWFGEHRLLSLQWEKPTLNLSFDEAIELLCQAILPIIQKTSRFAKLLFIWQPLYSERMTRLDNEELNNIRLFMESQGGGSLSKIYASKQLVEAYCYTKSKVASYFRCVAKGKTRSAFNVKFIDLSQSLPKGCLADVTHLNRKGHAWLAHQVHYHVKHSKGPP